MPGVKKLWPEKSSLKIFAAAQLGYAFLGLSAVVALTQVFFVYYNLGDEGDTLAVGWLISKGWVLYKDIFSHHFPLSYLWVALVVKLFGASVLPVRVSLIVLRTLMFALAMKISRYRLALGITALSWSLIGYLYLGNGLLYHSFSGIILVSGVAIGLALMTGAAPVKKGHLFVLGVLAGLMGINDPLKFLPMLALIVFVEGAIILHTPRGQRWPVGWRSGLILLGGMSLSLGLYLSYATLTHSLDGFYQNAIAFNLFTYSQYTPIPNLSTIGQVLTNGLDILNPAWRTLSPAYQWSSFETLDHWIFTGFFYRFAILAACFIGLVQRKSLLALALYVIAALTTLRGAVYFHASPFVLLALFISALLLTGSLPTRTSETGVPGLLPKTIPLLTLPLAVMFVWLNLRGAAYLFQNPAQLTYTANFNPPVLDTLRPYTCDPDVRLLVYPLNPLVYFLTGIPPASPYLFMTPWTAEKGQADAIESLSRPPVIVNIQRDFILWNQYHVTDYLHDFLTRLDQTYLPTEDGSVYVSPDLSPCP